MTQPRPFCRRCHYQHWAIEDCIWPDEHGHSPPNPYLLAELQKELAAAELIADREAADREAEEAALARIAARGKSEEEAREKRDRTVAEPGPDLGSTEGKVGTPVPEPTAQNQEVSSSPGTEPKKPLPSKPSSVEVEVGAVIRGWTVEALVGHKKDGTCLYLFRTADGTKVICKRQSAGNIWSGKGGMKWSPPLSWIPVPGYEHLLPEPEPMPIPAHTVPEPPAPQATTPEEATTASAGTSLQTAVDL